MLATSSFCLLWLARIVVDDVTFRSAMHLPDNTTARILALTLIAPVFLFPFTPLLSWYSRKHEYEADDYAAALTGAAPLASALLALYRDNAATLTPDPLHSAFFDSHPPALARWSHLMSLQPATPVYPA